MSLLHPQLAAFSAVLEEGSFEAAARRLNLTQSAISQRIKALEDRLGQVLIVRQAPCRPTPAGEQLLRRVRPMQTLEEEVLADFLPDAEVQHRNVCLAVNDDSLETWFLPALAALHAAHGYTFDLRVDDQDHTLDLLRDGSALGAVTADAKALQGCNVHPLGTMRYLAIAAPAFKATHFGAGVSAASLATAPMIVFNRKDRLQARYLRTVTRATLAPPVHYLPTSTGFVEAAALGLGWCLVPESLAITALKTNAVDELDPARWIDVPLYWQHAAIRSTTLQRITAAMRDAASKVLRDP
ncbi:LysR family transcriptional regulator ArgP [Stenotrophomonas sp. SAM-B]|uniref:LysR family transcriptional regulator ArgP n=1 Tax=Stenotrophomonas sp. SAM-B TaxID=2729141 RepID=UPI0015A06A67|nr:LysR family transcriptional regulator ArgP [Stenotrophomonas sp. SAM-B]NWF32640.1 LysR family transcriptional regulator ArgP [Stenotrophomonas sp. SAM-B]